jgi:hypothetical protein
MTPGLSLTGVRLGARPSPRHGVSRVASVPVMCVLSPLPRWGHWLLISLSFPSGGSFPCVFARSASTLPFSRPARHSLALRPAHSRSRLPTLSIAGFRWIVAYHLPQLLPAGATLAGRDFPLSGTVPLHGTRIRSPLVRCVCSQKQPCFGPRWSGSAQSGGQSRSPSPPPTQVNAGGPARR